jgi:hypothetical protein
MDKKDALELMADEFLKNNDNTPIRKRKYLSDRQLQRRRMKEIPISSLNKYLSSSLDNELYSIFTITE